MNLFSQNSTHKNTIMTMRGEKSLRFFFFFFTFIKNKTPHLNGLGNYTHAARRGFEEHTSMDLAPADFP